MAAVYIHKRFSDGTYRIIRSAVEPNWPKVIRDRKNAQAHYLGQDPIFPRSKPVRLETWEDFLNYRPQYPLPRPGTRSMMIVEDDAFWPVTYQAPLSEDEKEIEILALNSQADEVAAARSSQQDLENKLIAPAFLMVVAAATFVVFVIALLAVNFLLLGDAPTPPLPGA